MGYPLFDYYTEVSSYWDAGGDESFLYFLGTLIALFLLLKIFFRVMATKEKKMINLALMVVFPFILLQGGSDLYRDQSGHFIPFDHWKLYFLEGRNRLEKGQLSVTLPLFAQAVNYQPFYDGQRMPLALFRKGQLWSLWVREIQQNSALNDKIISELKEQFTFQSEERLILLFLESAWNFKNKKYNLAFEQSHLCLKDYAFVYQTPSSQNFISEMIFKSCSYYKMRGSLKVNNTKIDWQQATPFYDWYKKLTKVTNLQKDKTLLRFVSSLLDPLTESLQEEEGNRSDLIAFYREVLDPLRRTKDAVLLENTFLHLTKLYELSKDFDRALIFRDSAKSVRSALGEKQ